MAETISRYNHTMRLLLDGSIDLSTLRIMLLDATASFTATHTTLDQVAGANTPPRAKEVAGNGWTAGGQTIGSVAVTTVSTSGAMIDGSDVEVTASGGPIGPASGAVIFDDSHASKAPLWFVDFGAAQEAGDGTPFKITINASGICRVT